MLKINHTLLKISAILWVIWGGVVTIIGGIFIWRKNVASIFVSALVGGLLDVGYFIFIDLGGYNNFVPGTVMTIISSLAIILSFYAYFRRKPSEI